MSQVWKLLFANLFFCLHCGYAAFLMVLVVSFITLLYLEPSTYNSRGYRFQLTEKPLPLIYLRGTLELQQLSTADTDINCTTSNRSMVCMQNYLGWLKISTNNASSSYVSSYHPCCRSSETLPSINHN